MREGAAFILAALLVGCSAPKGPLVAQSPADLDPDGNPGNKASLRLGELGTKAALQATVFDVKLDYSHRGNEVLIGLQTQGETLERERYEATPTAFRILSATDDSFAPGIDLIRFPAYDGDHWDWSGKVVYAGISRSATAKIALRKEGSSLVSEVQLAIVADPGRADLQRKLRFEFEKGKGVVRRTFGGVSSRRPQGEPWRP